MRIEKRTSQITLTVALTLLSPTLLLAQKVVSRPIVIRYDGASINLPEILVNSLLNRENIRKTIHEDLDAVAIGSDPNALQPAGVLAGILQLEFKADSEIKDDELFQSARKTIEKELGGRIWEPQMIRLTDQGHETRERLSEIEDEITHIHQTMEAEALADGQLESMQSQLDEMQQQAAQVRMESKVEELRTKLIQDALSNLMKRKEELVKQKMGLDENLEKTMELERMTARLEQKKIELQQKLGAGHPEMQQITAQIKAISESMGTVDTELIGEKKVERTRAKALSEAVSQELIILDQQTARLAKLQQDRGMDALLAERKLEILETETEPAQERVKKLRRQMPRIQSRLERLKKQMQLVETEREEIASARRNLQRVTVEIW